MKFVQHDILLFCSVQPTAVNVFQTDGDNYCNISEKGFYISDLFQ